MEDTFGLKRFLDAQSGVYQFALNEIINGRKESHWMWYIFPQYKGLGRSSTSRIYAIKGLEEAKAYLDHPILSKRLIEITNAFLLIENKTAFQILGRPDDMKLKSSMTLFDTIQNDTDLFRLVLNKYFQDERCFHTINGLRLNK